MFVEVFVIVSYSVVSLLLSSVIVFAALGFIERAYDIEKVSPYECGFQPFKSAREQFDIRFYLVAIAFLIFDLEIIFLFPWCLIVKTVGKFTYFLVYTFLVIILLGFLYEWHKGGLDLE